MMRKNIGLIAAMLMVVSCAGDKGSTGPAGAAGTQGQAGAPGPGPSVSWTNPAPGSTNVPLDSVIRAGFSKAMDASTLNSSTFQVSAGGVQIAGTISYNSGAQTAYFSPGLPLTGFTSFSAVFTTGVKTTDGVALAQNYTWSFTTGGSYAPSRIYVGNATGNSVLVYNNAGSANGNIFPDRNISGASTLQGWTTGLWLDTASDRLYVSTCSNNNILIFNNAGAATGNIAPSRNITGAATTLNCPGGIWLDAINDRLYVNNDGANSILVFNNASTINGNIAPTRTIAGGNTTLNNNYGQFWLDAATDRLYVTNYSNNSILVFAGSTANGNIAPTRTIAGGATTLNGPYGIWLDSASDKLYVANWLGNSVLVFDNASVTTGNVAPTRTIAGAATTLNRLYGIWLDSATDRLYVASSSNTRILVFNNASAANGDIAPSRTVTGANTLLSAPRGIWLDSGD